MPRSTAIFGSSVGLLQDSVPPDLAAHVSTLKRNLAAGTENVADAWGGKLALRHACEGVAKPICMSCRPGESLDEFVRSRL